MSKHKTLTADEAIARLSEYEGTVHAFKGMFGCDWSVDEAHEHIRASEEVVEVPERTFAYALRHRVAARGPDGRFVAFATKNGDQP